MRVSAPVEDLQARVDSLRASNANPSELGDALYELATNLFFEPKRATPIAREMIEIAERVDDDLLRARGLRLIGTANYISVRYTDVLEYLLEALPVFLEHDDRFEYACSNLIMASVSQNTGAYDKALEQCFKAMNAVGADYPEFEAWVSYRMSDIYRELGDTGKTMEFAQNCFERFSVLVEQTGVDQHRVGLARARTQVGVALQGVGRFKEALDLNLEGLEIYESVGNELGRARCLSDIGMIYRQLNEPDKAEDYSRQALALRQKIGHRASQSTDLLALGELYLDRGVAHAAEMALEEALTIALESGIQLRAYQAHEALARVHELRGDPEKALRHYRAYQAIKDELAGEAMNLRIHNTKVLAEIDRAEKEAAFERAKSEEFARLLADLKSAQDRLVQSEKMASLGQLTAGIAHEIKNPLNFVNNFAHLSVELMDELLVDIEERRSALPPDFVEEMDAIISDLRINAKKIHQHGGRAESIVRSMLEHSRSSPGVEQVVDLNAFLEEFVNLAWHGAKASDAAFQVEVERDYGESVGSVTLIAQDMGRTFINLLNNAFHAVRERADSEGKDYHGIVGVKTARSEGGVEVRISDNGPGVPEAFLKQIFDPFFTTKAAGSGTGLGLSMSFDIVTKGHGGTLDVESTEGAGAAFVIKLPA
jgi:two-component system NtrC family sensor kinase